MHYICGIYVIHTWRRMHSICTRIIKSDYIPKYDQYIVLKLLATSAISFHNNLFVHMHIRTRQLVHINLIVVCISFSLCVDIFLFTLKYFFLGNLYLRYIWDYLVVHMTRLYRIDVIYTQMPLTSIY